MKKFLLFLLLFFYGTGKGMEGYFYVNADSVNLREEPSIKGKIIEVLKKDTIVFPQDGIPYNVNLPVIAPGGYTNDFLEGRWIEVIVSNSQKRGWIFSPYLGYKFTNITNGFIFETGVNKTNEKRVLLFCIGKMKNGFITDVTTNDSRLLKKIFKEKKTNSMYLYYLSGKVKTNILVKPKMNIGYNIFEAWPGNEMIEIEADLLNKFDMTNFSYKTFLGDFNFGSINIETQFLSNDNEYKEFIISNNIEHLKSYVVTNATNISYVTNETFFVSTIINKKKKIIFSNIVLEYYEYDGVYFDTEFDTKYSLNAFSIYIAGEKGELKNIYLDFNSHQGVSGEIEFFYMLTDLNNDKIPEIWTRVYCYESSYYNVYIFYKDILIKIASIGWTGV